MVTIIPKSFFVYIVVENYIAIFAMPIAVFEIEFYGLIKVLFVTFDTIMPCDV